MPAASTPVTVRLPDDLLAWYNALPSGTKNATVVKILRQALEKTLS